MTPSPVSPLVEAASSGSQDAWDEIVQRFERLVWSTIRGFRLDAATSADIAQTTWLRLVENLDRIGDPERIGAWLATTARRESIRVARDLGRSVPIGDEEVLESLAPHDALDIDASLLRDERDSALWRAFARISERCRRLLRLLTADPALAYEDVSAAMDMPVGSIGPTRQRCLARLRDELAVEGITE